MIGAGLLQGMGGFALCVVTVAALLRTARSTEPVLVVISASLVVWLLALALLTAAGQTVNFWVYGTSYWFFSLCFLVAFGAIYKSLSLRILLDLSERPGRADSYDRIFERYVAGESYKNRLQVIQNNRLAVCSDCRFSLTPRGRRLIGAIRFGINKSG
jgi:hypothetical protein